MAKNKRRISKANKGKRPTCGKANRKGIKTPR